MDAGGRVGATTIPVRADEPPPVADQRCFMELSQAGNESCISQPHIDPDVRSFPVLPERAAGEGRDFNGTAQVAVSADQLVDLWSGRNGHVRYRYNVQLRMAPSLRRRSPEIPGSARSAWCRKNPDRPDRQARRRNHQGAAVSQWRRMDHCLFEGRQQAGLYRPQSRQKGDHDGMACQSGDLWPDRSERRSRHRRGTG